MKVELSREEAEMIASQVIVKVSRDVLWDALELEKHVAAWLTQRLQVESTGTLAMIEKLNDGASPRPSEGVSEGRSKSASNGKSKKAEVVNDDREALKSALRQHLKEVGKTTRKQICEALQIESAYTYNKLMQDMKGELKARGQRSKRTYQLR
jgi:hypothetical protein